MKTFKCANCNVVILNSENLCRKCGSPIVECKHLEVFNDDREKTINKFIEEGFEVINKKRIVERTDEQDFYGFELEFHRPI